MITDVSGNLVWAWDNSDPFGANLPNENPSGQGTFTNNLGYSGQYRDKETNTFYNFFRDCYDPATGRYCQSDPIGLYGGSLSTYTYVGGNPLRYSDPLGLEWKDSLSNAANSFLQWRQNNLDNLARAMNGDANASLQVGMGLITRGSTAGQCAISASTRATQIADTLGKSKGFITIGVTDTAEGVRIISSSENALRPAALNALTEGEVAVTGAGHAEVTGINAANEMGLTPTGTAASRPICPGCAQFLNDNGVTPLSSLK